MCKLIRRIIAWLVRKFIYDDSETNWAYEKEFK
jgi:hypothetical protein